MTTTTQALKERAKFLKRLTLKPVHGELVQRLLGDEGAAAGGFQLRQDADAALSEGKSPLVLPLTDEDACQYQIGDEVTLVNADGADIGVLTIEDKWTPTSENDQVKALAEAGSVFFGGPVLRLA